MKTSGLNDVDPEQFGKIWPTCFLKKGLKREIPSLLDPNTKGMGQHWKYNFNDHPSDH